MIITYRRCVYFFWTLTVLLLAGSVYVHVFHFAKEQINPKFYAKGKQLYLNSGCADCHGRSGNAPTASFYPRVSNQPKAYILTQLKDIKSGKRNNGGSMLMRPFMEPLDESRLTLIAYYLSHANP